MRCVEGGAILRYQVESFLNQRFIERINTQSILTSAISILNKGYAARNEQRLTILVTLAMQPASLDMSVAVLTASLMCMKRWTSWLASARRAGRYAL